MRLLGTPLDTIRLAEDRQLFKEAMLRDRRAGPGERRSSTTSRAGSARSPHEAGYPLVVRPGVHARRHRRRHRHDRSASCSTSSHPGCRRASSTRCCVETSLLGWKEIEYEVLRDGADNCIIVCNMENLDPMGVHTGDSIVVAPSQTLSDRDYQMPAHRQPSTSSALSKVEGGCNIQFALDPASRRSTTSSRSIRASSRSSALASKATGYPIAQDRREDRARAALDEIPNPVTGVTKPPSSRRSTTASSRSRAGRSTSSRSPTRGSARQMKSTGEVMAIGRTFGAGAAQGGARRSTSGATR